MIKDENHIIINSTLTESEMRQISNRDYTMQDEQNRLENFLKEVNVEYDRNYMRMEKGPKPFFYKALTLSYQLRHTILEFYFLVFTEDSIILLTQDKEYEFTTNNMVKINHHDIQDFSFQKIYGAYCIFFEYQKKEYYFYLNDSFSTRVLGNVFGTDKIDYSRKNLSYLETMNFMGLLKSR